MIICVSMSLQAGGLILRSLSSISKVNCFPKKTFPARSRFTFHFVDSYRHCGDYKAALDVWLTKTLPVYKEQLGIHPWTASILQHIASMYLEFARENPTEYADLAETYTREALQLRANLLADHQDTARSHVSLSEVYSIQGKLNLALNELETAVAIQENVLGVRQQDTIDTLNKITDVLRRLGREREAEERKT